MLTNQILQITVDGLRTLIRKDIAIFDRECKLCASTDDDVANVIPHEYIKSALTSMADNQLISGSQYFKIADSGIAEYVLVIPNESEEAFLQGKLAAFHIESLVLAYKDKYDRDNFIKSLLLDNLLLVDINTRAKRLDIENAVKRIVYLVKTEVDADTGALEILRGIFPEKQKDFVTQVDESNILLVKELSEDDSAASIEQVAHIIVDTLASEAMSRACVAIGAVCSDLTGVSSSFKEAMLAQEVGRIFEPDKQIVNYDKLGIGRLIYQLPLPLCKIFINEMFQGFNMDDIDEEMYATVTKFFENDLNVSETSRVLFIHRNTLVYRLDKLEKLTKLDLRRFTDAITFKIALMVNRYMQFRER